MVAHWPLEPAVEVRVLVSQQIAGRCKGCMGGSYPLRGGSNPRPATKIKITMYTLIRKRDKFTFKGSAYKNVRYKMDGNTVTEFPPEIGCGIIVFNQVVGIMVDYWRTTIIKTIKKINDNEYIVQTKNSEYKVLRDLKK